MRDMRGKFAVVIGVLYVAFVVWSLYGAVFPVETHIFRMVHLAFIFGLTFLAHPPARKVGRPAWWLDLALAIPGVASIAYARLDLDQFIRRSTLQEPMDVFFGLVAIVLLLELSRRVVDTTFTLVVLGFRRGGS